MTMTTSKVRWHRNDELKVFGQVMADRGWLSTHRIGWTATLRLGDTSCPKTRKVLETVGTRWPRFIMRWRRDKGSEEIYLRLALILDHAHVELPELPGVACYFAYGRSATDPITTVPMGEGLQQWYHGSPHIVLKSFTYQPDGPKGNEAWVNNHEIARIENEKRCFSTYFWVDVKDPEDWTYDNVNYAVDELLQLAAVEAAEMRAAVQPGTPLYGSIFKKIPAGLCRLVKKCSHVYGHADEVFRRSITIAPEAAIKGLQRGARWALRGKKDEALRSIHKAGVDFDDRTKKRYGGGIVHAIVAIKVAREMGAEDE